MNIRHTALLCLNFSILAAILVGAGAGLLGVVAVFRPGLNFTIAADAPRLWTQVVIVLLLTLTTIQAALAGSALTSRFRMATPRVSLRMVGWLPLAGSAAIILLSLVLGSQVADLRIVETVVPLAVGIHVALAFAQDDDPPLEVALTYPRPVIWTVLERAALVFALHALVGLGGTLLTVARTGSSMEALPTLIVNWLVPSVFFAGLGMFMTLLSRQSIMGICVVLIVWFGTRFFFDGAAAMFSFLWPVHLFLQRATFGDYTLNRLFVTLAGLGLVYLAARQLDEEERVLLGGRFVKPKGAA